MAANSGVILPDGSTATDADGNELVTDDAGLCPECCNPCGSCAATCRTCERLCGDCTPRAWKATIQDVTVEDVCIETAGDTSYKLEFHGLDFNGEHFLFRDLRSGINNGLSHPNDPACYWVKDVPANILVTYYDGPGCTGSSTTETIDHITIEWIRSRFVQEDNTTFAVYFRNAGGYLFLLFRYEESIVNETSDFVSDCAKYDGDSLNNVFTAMSHLGAYGGTALMEMCPTDEPLEDDPAYDAHPCEFCIAEHDDIGDCGCSTPDLYGVTISDVVVCFDEDITAGDDDEYVYSLSGTTDPNRQINLEQDADNNCRWFAQIESDHVLTETRTQLNVTTDTYTLDVVRGRATKSGADYTVEGWIEGDGQTIKIANGTAAFAGYFADFTPGRDLKLWIASSDSTSHDLCATPKTALSGGTLLYEEIGDHVADPGDFVPDERYIVFYPVGVYSNQGVQDCGSGVTRELTGDDAPSGTSMNVTIHNPGSVGTDTWEGSVAVTDDPDTAINFTFIVITEIVSTVTVTTYDIDTIRYEFIKDTPTTGTWGVIGYDGETPRVRYATNLYSETPACKITPIVVTSDKCRPGTAGSGNPVLHGSGACCAKSNATGNFGSEGQTVFEPCPEEGI